MTLPPLPPRPEGLPKYNHPPVDEVVVGLQLSSVAGIEALAGQYREAIKADYPVVQYQPRLPPSPPANSPQPVLLISPAMPPGAEGNQGNRIWLVSQDETSLIQLQSDRFVYNWRNRGKPYPRFEAVYTEFAQRFSVLAGRTTSTAAT
jgi:uncharacterized protein (TIGR04255 family)